MSVITDLTRMWLTRSTKPFTFLNEYDETYEAHFSVMIENYEMKELTYIDLD